MIIHMDRNVLWLPGPYECQLILAEQLLPILQYVQNMEQGDQQ